MCWVRRRPTTATSWSPPTASRSGSRPEPLANPGFTKFASFSSGGPRTGDLGAKANVTAPASRPSRRAWGPVTTSATLSARRWRPRTAGVAALNVQAHPTWSSADIAANLVNTADPSKVGDYRLTLGGAGLVDVAQSVRSQITVTGDKYQTESGTFKEASA